MRQRASNVFGFFVLISLLWAVAGCDGGATPVSPQDLVAEKPEVTNLSTQWTPADDAPVMINGDQRLRIHDTEEAAMRVFPRPRGAFDFFEEPPVEGDDFVAKGWQSNAEAFGMLLLRNRIVLALYTLENVDTELLASKLTKYEEGLIPLTPSAVPGDVGSYWFWESGRTRLMMVHSRDAQGRGQLVVALGDTEIMDALRMAPGAARQDLTEARTRLQRQIEGEP